MKWLFYLLFAFGCMASLATYGAQDKRQKRTYLILAVSIWLVILILANTIL